MKKLFTTNCMYNEGGDGAHRWPGRGEASCVQHEVDGERELLGEDPSGFENG